MTTPFMHLKSFAEDFGWYSHPMTAFAVSSEVFLVFKQILSNGFFNNQKRSNFFEKSNSLSGSNNPHIEGFPIFAHKLLPFVYCPTVLFLENFQKGKVGATNRYSKLNSWRFLSKLLIRGCVGRSNTSIPINKSSNILFR